MGSTEAIRNITNWEAVENITAGRRAEENPLDNFEGPTTDDTTTHTRTTHARTGDATADIGGSSGIFWTTTSE